VVIDPNYGIGNVDEPKLSPPNVEPVSACADHVFVNSFMPNATVTVYVNGSATADGGPVTSKNAFAAIHLTKPLAKGDQLTATQNVNGVTSARSAPMVVGAMPATLSHPMVGKDIFACGRVAPVDGLASGVVVEVWDMTETPNQLLGTGFTPNDWGADWAPVVTNRALAAGHKIEARESVTCKGGSSSASANPLPIVPPELSSIGAPVVDPPVIGNDTITLQKLLTGSTVTVSSGSSTLATGFATSATNFVPVTPDITHSDSIVAQQKLCDVVASSPPATPVAQLPAPKLIGPICPGQAAAIVANSTLNANLVLLKNGAVVGYGGAAPGNVPLDIIPHESFQTSDKVQVVEYIAASPSDIINASSNIVTVECENVVTYHNDAQRTGWNSKEHALTPANVDQKTFGLIASAELDDDNDQVDAQPLIVTNQPIEGQGVHTVAYVATENNSIYAIDAFTGAKLKKVNLGTPVQIPNCNNNAMAVGINGTPTIDVRTKTLYVIAYVMVGTTPSFHLHALDLETLKDLPGSPTTFNPAYTLKPGSTVPFEQTYQRQRTALLQANGDIYAGFASYCDHDTDKSRGWVLGWNQTNLKPISSSNELINKSPPGTSFYLSSVWMSGYGIAADPDDGSLFFTTGNTGTGTYNGKTNLAESLVKLSPDLSAVDDYFTPSNAKILDQDDGDLGAGGAMVLPDQTSPGAGGGLRLVVAAGKNDSSYPNGNNFFIVNRETGKMGEFNNPDAPAAVKIGECHCGPSYFKGADGVARVISSGDSQVTQWTLTSAATPTLTMEASAQLAVSGQDGGFFTSVSSDGSNANTPIIWAVDRPIGAGSACNPTGAGWPPSPDQDPAKCFVSLYAFDATVAAPSSTAALRQLGKWQAGTWTYTNGNTNIVPTVANGMVYVASFKQLQIFGLSPQTGVKPRRTLVAAAPTLLENQVVAANSGPTYWGIVQKVDGSRIFLQLRTGRILTVDISGVPPQLLGASNAVGRAVGVNGALDPDGVLVTKNIWRAKGPALWGDDRDQ